MPAPRRADETGRPRAASRFAGVDQLRGLAIAMMVGYHLCYDLAYFRMAPWSADDMLLDPGWIAWRDLIVASFLLLVGVSRALNAAFKPAASDFWKRWGQIALGAVLVSLASFGFAGERWIYFGILHFVAAALLVCRLVLHRTQSARWIAALGALALAAGLLIATPAMDAPPLNILGFAAHKPPTEDYVPLFPWIGVVLIGLAGGLRWRSHDFVPLTAVQRLRAVVPAPLQRLLAAAGRWSLSIYLVHQPLLMGVFTAVVAARR